ncbi:MAG: response regulator [Planctomycetia bacterium]|nr:response regulator [Planctomycetia bacterium]
MMSSPTVFLVDDDAAVTRAITSLASLMLLRILPFASAESFLAIKDEELQNEGCLILDIRLPGMSGLDLQRTLRERQCALPVIIISGHADVPLTVEAMRGGALTVLEKPFGLEMIKSQILRAIDLDHQRRDQERQRDLLRERLNKLTAREREVLALIPLGLTNKQIAAQLHLTLRAIEDRRARLMRRLGVRSIAELLLLVQQAQATT